MVWYHIKLNKCVNKNIPGRTEQDVIDYYKIYYEDNKEHIIEYKREYNSKNKAHIHERKEVYYINNRDHTIEQVTKYYIENKEQIKEWQSTKCLCECGNEYTKSNKARHDKSSKHMKYCQIIQ